MFIVTTQTLENYGAHSESGKFADGQNYWKFKGGDTYLVEDLDREQDAVAFVPVIAKRFLLSRNDSGYRETIQPSNWFSQKHYWFSCVCAARK